MRVKSFQVGVVMLRRLWQYVAPKKGEMIYTVARGNEFVSGIELKNV